MKLLALAHLHKQNPDIISETTQNANFLFSNFVHLINCRGANDDANVRNIPPSRTLFSHSHNVSDSLVQCAEFTKVI